MKIVKSFSENYNYMFVLDKIPISNLSKIESEKSYKVKFDENFSYCILNKLNKLNKLIIINFTDYQLFYYKNNFKLRSINTTNDYILNKINRINLNYVKYINSEKKDFLVNLIDEYSFIIKNDFNLDIVNKVFELLDSLYNTSDYENFDYQNYLDPLISIFISGINNNIFDKNELIEILDLLSKVSDDILFDNYYFTKIIYEILIIKIQEFEWDDSLISEILNFSKFPEIKSYYNIFYNLSNLLQIDIKIKNILDKFDLNSYSQMGVYDSVYNCKNSKELYHSIITQTNWIEELECGNIMGLLLNINPKEINKNGYNLDYVPIDDITHTIVGFDQILEAYNINKDNNYECVMSGYGVGNGNCFLPLYIDPNHWKLVEIYLNYNLGILFNRNSLNLNKNHKELYKNVLVKMINLTFSDDGYKSEKWINLLFSVLRTNYELFKNDYNDLKKFKKNIKFRTTCNINNILFNYLLNDNYDDCIEDIIFEEVIRRTLKSLYRNIDILDNIYDFNINLALNYEINYNDNNLPDNLVNDLKFKNWIKDLENNNIFSEKITLIYGIIMMKTIIKRDKSFINFDNNCGVLSNENMEYVKNFIQDTKILPENVDLSGILNTQFKNHVNITKDKVFSVNAFIKLNLVENIDALKGMFIQGLIQRVNKCRKKAIENNKVQNPFNDNNIIKYTGLLISQRFIKNYYNLTNYESYINVLNILDTKILEKFINCMIKKTFSIKSDIVSNIIKINSDRVDIVLNLLKS